MNFRKFTAAVLSCVMVLSLAACRRGPSETKAPATAPTEAVTQAVTKAPETAAAPETTKAPETTAAPEPEKQSVQPVHECHFAICMMAEHPPTPCCCLANQVRMHV